MAASRAQQKSNTLRNRISDLVNELNKLLLRADNPEAQKKLRKLRRIFFALWEEVIEQQLNRRTRDYKNALVVLDSALKTAMAANADISKLAKAIDQAVFAAKAVDNVVQLLSIFRE